MANLRLYAFPEQSRGCNTHLCRNIKTQFVVAREDIDYGTAMATGLHLCTDCAVNLATTIPTSFLSDDTDIETRIRAEEREKVTAELQEKYEAELAKSNAMFETLNAQFQTLKEELEQQKADQDDDEDIPAFVPEPANTVVDDEQEEDTFRCLDCNKDFTTKKAYNAHMVAKHKEKG